jgi:calcium-independent phospholipase A2-gamma
MLRPFVFRNYTLPFRVQSLYSGTFRHKMWEAVRASSAAPGYFGEFKLEENLHQDGGLFVNNPCAVAIHEAKCIWPNAKLLSVVSIGTGRCQPLNMAAGVNAIDPTNTSLKQKLSKVIDSATDTEVNLNAKYVDVFSSFLIIFLLSSVFTQYFTIFCRQKYTIVSIPT